MEEVLWEVIPGVAEKTVERVLLETQTECTFMWTNKAGEPVGVIMNYLWHDGRFWLTATARRMAPRGWGLRQRRQHSNPVCQWRACIEPDR